MESPVPDDLPTNLLGEVPTEELDLAMLKVITDHEYRTLRAHQDQQILLIETLGPYLLAVAGLLLLAFGVVSSSSIAQVLGAAFGAGGTGTKVGQKLTARRRDP